jgi:hypothetical protein
MAKDLRVDPIDLRLYAAVDGGTAEKLDDQL